MSNTCEADELPQNRLSVNQKAWHLAKKLLESPEEYGVLVKETKYGIIIDAGIDARGGFQAGKIITEICLGGYGEATITSTKYDDLTFPSIFSQTNYPPSS